MLPWPREEIPSGRAAVVVSAEGTRVQSGAGIPAIKATANSWFHWIAVTEARVAVVIVVAIKKCRSLGEIRPATKVKSPVIPIESPSVPSPTETKVRPYSKTNPEVQAWTVPPNAWYGDPSRPRIDRISVNSPWIVSGNIDFIAFGHRGVNADVAVLVCDVDLIVALS